MAFEVTMPQMGADMTEGTLVRWVKQVGDQVNRGEIIAEIETDKATVELEAFESGVLQKHVVAEGETVPVGQVIALLGAAGEAAPAEEAPRLPRPEVRERKIDPAAKEAAKPAAATDHSQTAEGRARISPIARRIAHDAGIDPETLTGTGPDGRILRRDVEEAARGAKPATEPAPTAAAPPSRAPAPAASRAVSCPVCGYASVSLKSFSRLTSTCAERAQGAFVVPNDSGCSQTSAKPHRVGRRDVPARRRRRRRDGSYGKRVRAAVP